jgi:hypothetical protein
MMATFLEERGCSALYLQQILLSRYPDRFQVFADLFAMGCLLHFQGERCAGYKLIGQVFDAVSDAAEKRYLSLLLNSLSGNELRFAREIDPSMEVRELCDRAQQGAFREAACAR